MSNCTEIYFNINLWFFFNFNIFRNQIQCFILMEYLCTFLLPTTIFKIMSILSISLNKLANFYLFISNFMVENTDYLMCFFVSLDKCIILLRPLLKTLLKLANFHFETDDIVVLIAYYFFYSSHIDIWFFVEIAIEIII